MRSRLVQINEQNALDKFKPKLEEFLVKHFGKIKQSEIVKMKPKTTYIARFHFLINEYVDYFIELEDISNKGYFIEDIRFIYNKKEVKIDDLDIKDLTKYFKNKNIEKVKFILDKNIDLILESVLYKIFPIGGKNS